MSNHEMRCPSQEEVNECSCVEMFSICIGFLMILFLLYFYYRVVTHLDERKARCHDCKMKRKRRRRRKNGPSLQSNGGIAQPPAYTLNANGPNSIANQINNHYHYYFNCSPQNASEHTLPTIPVPNHAGTTHHPQFDQNSPTNHMQPSGFDSSDETVPKQLYSQGIITPPTSDE